MAMAVWPLWSGSGRVSHSRVESRILKWLWLLVMVWVITCTAAAAVARAGGSGDVSGGSAGYLSASRPEPRTQHTDINRDTVPTSNRKNYGNKDGDGAEFDGEFSDDNLYFYRGGDSDTREKGVALDRPSTVSVPHRVEEASSNSLHIYSSSSNSEHISANKSLGRSNNHINSYNYIPSALHDDAGSIEINAAAMLDNLSIAAAGVAGYEWLYRNNHDNNNNYTFNEDTLRLHNRNVLDVDNVHSKVSLKLPHFGTVHSTSPSTSTATVLSLNSSLDVPSMPDNSSRLVRIARSSSSSGFSLTAQVDKAPLNCSSAVEGPSHSSGIQLATLRWSEIGVYFTITAFIIFAGFGKLAFHQLTWLSSKVPESCLLIVLGVLMGLVVHFTQHSGESCNHTHIEFPAFSSQAFFLMLLPPIILESAYCLHDRAFTDNLGTVLIFAVFGTLLNTFMIGPCLFGLAQAGAMGDFNITMTESLVFSSLISAVDPVAVLSIFQDLGVNKGLYFLVFGESLLNDGVTVVVYNTLSVFTEMTSVKATDYVLSVLVFFIVTICGSLIGLIYGLLTALVTRITTTVRVVEPLAMLGLAYLAYLTAELFHFSGIISLIVCGLVQAHYAFHNISSKSYTCVKYFTKMASATSETIIFMFLGMVLVSAHHIWHTGFVLWTLFLCFVARFIITLTLSALTNRFRLHAIGKSEQLILAYGGLRGAVAFSLVSMLPETVHLRDHFVTATLVVILFTVFVQGITIRPLVNWLKVSKRASGPRQLFEEVSASVVDHMMAGIEEVLGQHGDFYLREQLRHYNEKYLKKWFVRSTSEAPLKRLFEKIAIMDHYAHLYGPAVLLQRQQEHLEEHLSLSRQKLLQNSSPYGSKQPSVQCLTTTVTGEQTLDAKKLNEVVKMRSKTMDQDQRRSLTPSSTAEEDAKVLRRAISSNPYNKLHYTFNRNLVDADNQELSDHLHRRHAKARRLTHLASQVSLRRQTMMRKHPNTSEAEVPHLAPLRGSFPEADGELMSRIHTPLSLRSLEEHDILQRPSSSIATALLDTIQQTTGDAPSLLVPDQQRRSGWNQSDTSQKKIHHSLPGQIHDHRDESIKDDDVPIYTELLDDIRRVNIIIDCHRRRSAYRQSMRQQRLRLTSEGSDSGRRPSESSFILPLTPELDENSITQQHQSSLFVLDELPNVSAPTDPLLNPSRSSRDRDKNSSLQSASQPESSVSLLRPNITDEEV